METLTGHALIAAEPVKAAQRMEARCLGARNLEAWAARFAGKEQPLPHWGDALYVTDRAGGEAVRYYLHGPDDVDGVPTLTVCDGYALEMDERHGGGPMTEEIAVAAVLRWGTPEDRYRRD